MCDLLLRTDIILLYLILSYLILGDEREDDCNTCTCLSGDWTCTEMYCGSGIKCEHEGTEYDEWEAREDDCKICTCVEGAWSCDDAGCDTTVTAKAKAHAKVFGKLLQCIS